MPNSDKAMVGMIVMTKKINEINISPSDNGRLTPNNFKSK
jgi:hypothetical protein